jgi:hypothetical protein
VEADEEGELRVGDRPAVRAHEVGELVSRGSPALVAVERVEEEARERGEAASGGGRI